MVFLLLFLVGLNIWLWRRRKNGPETVVEWTQNMEELEVDFPLPEGITSKDIDCRIMPTHLHFALRGHPEATLKVSRPRMPPGCTRTPLSCTTCVAQGTLLKKVKPEECNWQLWPVGTPPLRFDRQQFPIDVPHVCRSAQDGKADSDQGERGSLEGPAAGRGQEELLRRHVGGSWSRRVREARIRRESGCRGRRSCSPMLQNGRIV